MAARWMVTIVGVLVLLLSACAPAATPTPTQVATPTPKKPTTVAELAVYRGPDRQQILEEGAKKEGTLTYYTTGTVPTLVMPTIAAFQKKYPYIKVEYSRADSKAIATKVFEEYGAGKYVVDVLDSTESEMYDGRGIAQPFYSPELSQLEPVAVRKALDGQNALWAGHWETCIVLLYNTNKIKKEEAPKTYRDLLDPKWKGKITLPTTTTGHRIVGTWLTFLGLDFVKEMAAKQDIKVQNISGGALGEMVVSGEVPLTPATYTSNAAESIRAGAPVAVVFLEPVQCVVSTATLTQNAPHPNAALLFLDFTMSKEAAEVRDPLYASPRKDMAGRGLAAGPFKKWYVPVELQEPIKTMDEWGKLFVRLFVEKKLD